VVILLALTWYAAAGMPTISERSTHAGPTPPGAVMRLGKGSATALALSSDGGLLAVGANTGVFLFLSASMREVWATAGSRPVVSLAISPDNRLVAAGFNDGTLALLDAYDGSLLSTMTSMGDAALQSLAWAQAESEPGVVYLLASGLNDGNLLISSVLWSGGRLSATVVGQLGREPSGITALSFAANQRYLAAGDRSGQIHIWDVLAAARIATLNGHTPGHAVLSLAWSPGGKLLSGGRDGLAILWDPDLPTPRIYPPAERSEALAVGFLGSSANPASAGADGAISILEAGAGGSAPASWQLSPAWSAAAISQHGNLLAAAAGDGQLAVWDMRPAGPDPVAILRGFQPAAAWAADVAWSPDQTRLASGSGEQVVIWNADSGEREKTLVGHQGLVTALAWSADGSRLASGSKDRSVVVWRFPNGEPVLTLRGHTDNVSDVAWSPDGGMLASTGSLDNRLIVWDASSGEILAELSGPDTGLWSLAWSPDGRILAAGTTSGSILLWDSFALDDTPRELDGHVNWVTDLAWSADGSLLASTGSFPGVILWDADTGARIRSLAGHEDVVSGAAFSPSGDFLATVSVDGSVIIWGTGGRTPFQALSGHTAGVEGVSWSPGGSLVATSGRDGTVILWPIGP
jgi:WD40 repeat protein